MAKYEFYEGFGECISVLRSGPLPAANEVAVDLYRAYGKPELNYSQLTPLQRQLADVYRSIIRQPTWVISGYNGNEDHLTAYYTEPNRYELTKEAPILEDIEPSAIDNRFQSDDSSRFAPLARYPLDEILQPEGYMVSNYNVQHPELSIRRLDGFPWQRGNKKTLHQSGVLIIHSQISMIEEVIDNQRDMRQWDYEEYIEPHDKIIQELSSRYPSKPSRPLLTPQIHIIG